MLGNINLISYGTAALAFTFLTVLIVSAWWRGRSYSLPVFLAAFATTLWAVTIAAASTAEYPWVVAIQATEIARNMAWIYLLADSLLFGRQQRTVTVSSNALPIIAGAGAAAFGLLIIGGVHAERIFLGSDMYWRDLAFAAWLAMAVVGLVLIEQLYRNSSEADLWSTKYLCIGLGLVFLYDFFMYAEALLFKQLDALIWQSRGLVVALAAPLIAVSIARNKNWEVELHVSRDVVFHSFTLLASGVYLVLMSVVGYFIRYMGGTWGGVFQLTFLAAGFLGLVVLFMSGTVRSKVRVGLSKHFFSYQYDYRKEWLEFTELLAGAGENLPAKVIEAIATLVNSDGGLLWVRSDTGGFKFAEHFDMRVPGSGINHAALVSWLEHSGWVIDLKEWQSDPDAYQGLSPDPDLLAIPRAWLVIPLMLGQQLEGFVLLRESEHVAQLDWEHRDLLKVAGRQAASYLAQHESNKALVAARQFEAFNRLSAYVVHDLKNILAQQSLIVSNAEKHRDNPAFIDDVLATVSNSVARMTRLMDQMRSGMRADQIVELNLGELLADCVSSRRGVNPIPALSTRTSGTVLVSADREQLHTVFCHLIQNAQEATPTDGEVTLTLTVTDRCAEVEVKDNGSGMDADFVATRLFKPFDSTKGLTGMGIGAFESREYIRSLGGEISVESELGAGSLFRVVIPCELAAEQG
jgi:putative PEP-CTERM system histidine kinase